MATSTIVSKTGAPVTQLVDWVMSKNDAEITALYNQHVQLFTTGTPTPLMVNPALDAMFNQFFAETDQEIAMQ